MKYIDISGPDGNAFVLLGAVKNYGHELGMTSTQIGEIRNKMMSGDYENLCDVFEENFGTVVTLVGR